jgi:hypothetical protein
MSETVLSTEVNHANERPFPWRCPRCRQKNVWRATVPYTCQRTHGGTSISIDICELSVPRCRQCGELVFDYLAEAQINDAFKRVTEPGGLHGEQDLSSLKLDNESNTCIPETFSPPA